MCAGPGSAVTGCSGKSSRVSIATAGDSLITLAPIRSWRVSMQARTTHFLGAAILSLAGSVAANAQNTTGTISGTVRDQSQALVAGAAIAVTNEQTGLR